MNIQDLSFVTQESRLKILLSMPRKDKVPISGIKIKIGISRQAIHKNLKKLENRGFVVSEKHDIMRDVDDPRKYYKLTRKGLKTRKQVKNLDPVNDWLHKEKQEVQEDHNENMSEKDLIEKTKGIHDKKIECKEKVEEIVKDSDLWDPINSTAYKKEQEKYTVECHSQVEYSRRIYRDSMKIKPTFNINIRIEKLEEGKIKRTGKFYTTHSLSHETGKSTDAVPENLQYDTLEEAFEAANEEFKKLINKYDLERDETLDF